MANRKKEPEEIREPESEVELGQTVTRKITGFYEADGNAASKTMEGIVTYIHPLKRFHTVTFNMGDGYEIRESYPGVAVR